MFTDLLKLIAMTKEFIEMYHRVKGLCAIGTNGIQLTEDAFMNYFSEYETEDYSEQYPDKEERRVVVDGVTIYCVAQKF